MVRKSKIKELLNDKVTPLLDAELTKFGFRYLKSKNHFVRKDPKGFVQIINLHTPYPPLVYDDNSDQLFLIFSTSTQIEIPDYTKWYFEKFGAKPHISSRTVNLSSQVKLSLDEFDRDSFYTPTASQEFKRSITLSIIRNSDQTHKIIPIEEFVAISIPKLVADLSSRSDILKIYEGREHPFQHTLSVILWRTFCYSRRAG